MEDRAGAARIMSSPEREWNIINHEGYYILVHRVHKKPFDKWHRSGCYRRKGSDTEWRCAFCQKPAPEEFQLAAELMQCAHVYPSWIDYSNRYSRIEFNPGCTLLLQGREYTGKNYLGMEIFR